MVLHIFGQCESQLFLFDHFLLQNRVQPLDLGFFTFYLFSFVGNPGEKGGTSPYMN